MLPPKALFIAACLLISPVSQSQAEPTKSFDVTLTYDVSLLGSAEGASLTRKALMKQARSACRYKTIVTVIPRVGRHLGTRSTTSLWGHLRRLAERCLASGNA